MYTALEIAKYVITKCMEDGKAISNLQLQKILYFLQAAFLKKEGDSLFSEDFEAWQFGPVVPCVYNLYCTYGGSGIRRLYNDLNIGDDIREIIDPIIVRKRSKYPWDLVEETHKEGGAWHKAYSLGKSTVIDREWIRNDPTIEIGE